MEKNKKKEQGRLTKKQKDKRGLSAPKIKKIKLNTKNKFVPAGRYKEQIQDIGECLFTAGFDYTSSAGAPHHKFSHPKCKFCTTTFPLTPSDYRTIKNTITSIKKMCLTQCVPPISLDKLSAKFFTIKMAGFSETEKEITILDVLDEIGRTVTLTAQVFPETRDELKGMADSKGMAYGDLIEEMMDVYKKTQ